MTIDAGYCASPCQVGWPPHMYTYTYTGNLYVHRTPTSTPTQGKISKFKNSTDFRNYDMFGSCEYMGTQGVQGYTGSTRIHREGRDSCFHIFICLNVGAS